MASRLFSIGLPGLPRAACYDMGNQVRTDALGAGAQKLPHRLWQRRQYRTVGASLKEGLAAHLGAEAARSIASFDSCLRTSSPTRIWGLEKPSVLPAVFSRS